MFDKVKAFNRDCAILGGTVRMATVGVKGIIRLESDRGCDVLVCIHAVIN